MTMLFGSDVSKYNATPSPAGRSFLIAKATEATAVDPKFAHHAAAARAQGLTVGAYHFGRAAVTAPIAHQVEAFLDTAGHADFLALDLEPPSHVLQSDGTFAHPPGMTNAEAAAFIAIAGRHREVGLYHSLSNFPRIGQSWSWVAAYGRRGAPLFNRPRGLAYRFWQYGSVPYDLDVFMGNQAQLAALVAASHR